MLFSDSFSQPFNKAIGMCSHIGGFADDESELYETSFGAQGTSWIGPVAVEPSYANLVRLTNRVDKNLDVISSSINQVLADSATDEDVFLHAQIHQGTLEEFSSSLMVRRKFLFSASYLEFIIITFTGDSGSDWSRCASPQMARHHGRQRIVWIL